MVFRLKLYSNIARNLNKAADFAKTFERLFRGRKKIMEVLTSKLPTTQHDPYSFTADLIYKTVRPLETDEFFPTNS